LEFFWPCGSVCARFAGAIAVKVTQVMVAGDSLELLHQGNRNRPTGMAKPHGPFYNPAMADGYQEDDRAPDDSAVGDGNYTVQPGDCLSQIAATFGFDWKTLWNLPENASLRQNRKDPNVLFPGDRVYVPNLRIKHHDAATDKRHQFRLKGSPARLRLRFIDDGDPLAGEPYVLSVDGDLRNGTLDANGQLDVSILPTAKSIQLTIGNDEPITLKLGGVDPITTVSGVQGRLSNLGFNPGPIDNKMGPQTRHAIGRFQNRYGLEVTGKPDEATRAKLLKIHGC
jgi:N-acetylmuramoyl-L-alanine amidase